MGAGQPLILQGTEVRKTKKPVVYQNGKVIAPSEEAYSFTKIDQKVVEDLPISLSLKSNGQDTIKDINTTYDMLDQFMLLTNKASMLGQVHGEDWVSTPDFGPTLMSTIDDLVSYFGNTFQGKYLRSWIASQLHENLQKNSNIAVIDVRTRLEYNGLHIPGAISHDLYDDIEQFLDSGELDKDQPVVFVCANGPRGAKAGIMALEKGYTDVIDLIGGITNWAAAGYPVVY